MGRAREKKRKQENKGVKAKDAEGNEGRVRVQGARVVGARKSRANK